MKFKYAILFFCLVLPVSVLARTDCPAAKVTMIQIEDNVILYLQEGANWRRLGVVGELGTSERYSALLAAHMSGRKVVVAYASATYDCALYDLGTSANMVRLYAE